MTFLWPIMLVLLVLVPLFGFLYIRLQRRRRRLAESFSGLGFGSGSGAKRSRMDARRIIVTALFLIGLTILMVGLARPQTTVSLPRVEGTVILAFDVSGSMAADDLKPTRMDAAKAAARDFVQRQPSTVQIGVVGFTDSGFAFQPPTNDQAAVLQAISRMAPQRGTSVAHGIEASLNLIANTLNNNITGDTAGEPQHLSNQPPGPTPTPTALPRGTYTSAVIVMLSDGENNENPDPLAAAQTAADRGVRIYTVGIGSAAGTTLHINGFNVFTQLNEDLLKQIAQITGGTYYNAQSTDELVSIYDHLDPQLLLKPEKIEVTSIFAGASVLVLLAGGLFSMLWFSRVP